MKTRLAPHRIAQTLFVGAVFCLLAPFSVAAEKVDAPSNLAKPRHLFLASGVNQNFLAECDASSLAVCTADARASGAHYYSIPQFLKSFAFDQRDWKKSPALDRALVAAYRLTRVKNLPAAEFEAEIERVSQDLTISPEAIKAAEALMTHEPINAAQVRELSSLLRFQAKDLLRLEDSVALSSANAIYREDPNVFTSREWQELYSALRQLVVPVKTSEKSVGNGSGALPTRLHKIDLLTVPVVFRWSDIEMTEVANYLDRDQVFFYERFNDVQSLRSKLSPGEQEQLVEITCNSIRNFFVKESTPQGFDPFLSVESVELVNFYIDHATGAQRGAFVIDFARSLLKNQDDNSKPSQNKLVQIVIGRNLALIRATPSISSALFHLIVETPKSMSTVGFDFVDQLFEIWQKQGLFNNQSIRQKMVHNFETLFSAWDENFKNYEWFGCDWLGRIGQYSSLLAQDDQDLSAVRVLTGKFAKGDKHASIRQANEKTLIQLLDYLTRSEVNSTRVKSRLVTIMRNWAGSTPQLLGQYPDFESRLVQLIRRTFAGDNLGADSLVRALQSAAAIKVTSLATFMQKIKDTLAQSDRAGIDFNSFYANQIQRALSGIYNTGTDGRGGYLPLSPTDEKAAIALYRDFRLRAGSQLKYAFLSEEVRTARNHKLDKGPLFEMLNKELNKFGKYPVVGDSRPPHLTLIKCSELLAPEAKN